MLFLHRAAFRALTSPCISVSIKSRFISTLPSSSLTRNALPASYGRLQRRFASGEVTQAEPEADGATEAEHGENSIAASQDESSAEYSGSSAATSQDHSNTPESADQENHSTVASAVASAAGTATSKVSDAVQSAASTAAGFATSRSSRYSDLPKSPTVYVGNLFFDVTEDRLKQDFSKFGSVKSTKIIYDGRGLSKGFGYVEFENISAAEQAIAELNDSIYEGRRLNVQFSVRKERPASSGGMPGKPSKTLFIGNMSFEMSDQDLNDLFREIRDVTDVRVAIDRRTGQPRGFAHAEFNTEAGAEKAMGVLSGKEVYGRKLRVDYSSPNAKGRQP